MSDRFDYFVILAGMRTGSNFLEASLNEYPGLVCHGELFNPHFIGHAEQKELFGVSIAQREADPLSVVRKMQKNTAGLPGFRLFFDHDPRVLRACLNDPRAAKIILTRNPLDSYVSLKIAGETGQWRLGDMRHAKSAQIRFEQQEFLDHLSAGQNFQHDMRHALQTTGQTGYYLTYEDVQDVDVINGLARYLGITAERKATSNTTKKQNPGGLRDKVSNYAEMVAALSNLDNFGLSHSPVFEPTRGPTIPQYVAAPESPLLYMKIRGGPSDSVDAWLSELDGGQPVLRGFTQKKLRQWMRGSTGHRSFSILRHPVLRLHEVFCGCILPTEPGSYSEIRQVLRKTYSLPIPDDASDASYDTAAHRQAFLQFAHFVAGNLTGQTSVRVDAAWASQNALLQGMAQFSLPDLILREEGLEKHLTGISRDMGHVPPDYVSEPAVGPHKLDDIYNAEIEAAVRAAYNRDYLVFGFADWR